MSELTEWDSAVEELIEYPLLNVWQHADDMVSLLKDRLMRIDADFDGDTMMVMAEQRELRVWQARVQFFDGIDDAMVNSYMY